MWTHTFVKMHKERIWDSQYQAPIAKKWRRGLLSEERDFQSRKNVGEQWGRAFKKPLLYFFNWAGTCANETQVAVRQQAQGSPCNAALGNDNEGSSEPHWKVPLEIETEKSK